MPGKWTEQAERDLIFAVLASHMGGDLKVKVSWDAVKEQMHAWGHADFTKEAMNQRWSKTIVKDFKEGKGGGCFGASTPAKDTATAAGGTPASRKRKAAAAAGRDKDPKVDDDDENNDEQKKKKPVATPTPKKRKPSAKKTPKPETKAELELKTEEQPTSIFDFGDDVKRQTTH